MHPVAPVCRSSPAPLAGARAFGRDAAGNDDNLGGGGPAWRSLSGNGGALFTGAFRNNRACPEIGIRSGIPYQHQAPASGANGHGRIEAAMLGVVSDLTGYPVEMISLDMDIEADLGIDSIKRVEILSAFEEKMPHLAPGFPRAHGNHENPGARSSNTWSVQVLRGMRRSPRRSRTHRR